MQKTGAFFRVQFNCRPTERKELFDSRNKVLRVEKQQFTGGTGDRKGQSFEDRSIAK